MRSRGKAKRDAQFVVSVDEDNCVRLTRQQLVELVDFNITIREETGRSFDEAEEIVAFAERAGVGQVREWPGITVVRTH